MILYDSFQPHRIDGLDLPLGQDPVRLQCPHCHKEVLTITEYRNGVCTYICCTGFSLVGCILGCCLIPFCVDSLKDIEHQCPNCKHTIGYYKRAC
ncbi:Lipopolysaccharide-induced TNF-alpha factor [Fasciola gigantica]|uniref:Lipopolysaccharide-induced TNF-alpha factor n=1 Tax=Fasciola gigantica TaxID=46835 RepID=A0A504ZC59_FASGI|nr:Lipopolysaccharide-induced TNF-alpha factor [Fasciola gigantica]